METVSQNVQTNHPLSAPDLERDSTTYLYLVVLSCSYLTFKFGPIKLRISVSSWQANS